MGKYSRDKGKRGEREVAAFLCAHGYDAHRGQQYHGGKDSPDVVGLPGIHIEVKYTQRLSLWDAVKQAVRDSLGTGNIPVIFHRKAAEKGEEKPDWVVILRAEDFLAIYEAAHGK